MEDVIPGWLMKKKNIIPWVAICIAIIGIVIPIIIGSYKSKRALELNFLEQINILTKPENLDGLMITYAGEPIDGISKSIFSLENTGRSAIGETEVKKPVTLQFSIDSHIIDCSVEHVNPADLEVEMTFDKPNQNVQIKSSLLNPGDKIYFSVLSKSAIVNFDVSARIENISQIDVIQSVSTPDNKLIPWTAYPVGLFTALFGMAIIGGIVACVRKHILKKQIENDTLTVPTFPDTSSRNAWVRAAMYGFPKYLRQRVIDNISDLTDADSLDGENIKQIIVRYVYYDGSDIPFIFILSISTLIGLLYLASILN